MIHDDHPDTYDSQLETQRNMLLNENGVLIDQEGKAPYQRAAERALELADEERGKRMDLEHKLEEVILPDPNLALCVLRIRPLLFFKYLPFSRAEHVFSKCCIRFSVRIII